MNTSMSTLEETCKRVRAHIIRATTEAQSGHPSSSLSAVELGVTLYFGGVLKHNPMQPRWPGRDRFIMSKGHASPLLYALLAESGYFDKDRLVTLRKFGSELEGHPNMKRLAGVEASTGSLGQGLSVGIGHALAARLDGLDFRVYVLCGDGEMQEGQVWEGIMFAGRHGIRNLTLIVDRNRYQQTGPVKEILDLDPLAEKISAFGWETIQIDGHSIAEVEKAYLWAEAVEGKPQAILASTTKGRGVKFLESAGNWHGKPLPKEKLDESLAEIERGLD